MLVLLVILLILYLFFRKLFHITNVIAVLCYVIFNTSFLVRTVSRFKVQLVKKSVNSELSTIYRWNWLFFLVQLSMRTHQNSKINNLHHHHHHKIKNPERIRMKRKNKRLIYISTFDHCDFAPYVHLSFLNSILDSIVKWKKIL